MFEYASHVMHLIASKLERYTAMFAFLNTTFPSENINMHLSTILVVVRKKKSINR